MRIKLLAKLSAVALAAAVVVPTAPAQAAPLRDVLFVGNNWDGTADVVSAELPLRRLARVNVIPDIRQRMTEIYLNPVRLAYFLAIRQLIGEGHDQFVDDLYTTLDGRRLIVSRPSLADVVSI